MNRYILMAALMAAMTWCRAETATAQDKRPSNVFKLSIGPSLVTSDIYVPVLTPTGNGGVAEDGQLKMKGKAGIDVAATYQHLWGIGFGVGLDYCFSNTWFSDDYGRFTHHYIGPSFVFAYRGWKHFGLEAATGIGYVRSRDMGYPAVKAWPINEPRPFKEIAEPYGENGLGFMTRLGAEYRFNAHWGIGADFQIMSTQFNIVQEVGENGQVVNDGIVRLNLLIGVRYLF